MLVHVLYGMYSAWGHDNGTRSSLVEFMQMNVLPIRDMPCVLLNNDDAWNRANAARARDHTHGIQKQTAVTKMPIIKCIRRWNPFDGLILLS